MDDKRTGALGRFSEAAWIGLELLILLVWALWFTRPYLNMQPSIWPSGREFGSQVQAYHFWDAVKECGGCALWNGQINGGAPAFADVFSATFHPAVALLVLGFGVVNGIKLALVFFFWLAGFAQWWIGWQMGLSRLARVWAGMLMIVGGHLAARMTFGAHALIFSTASCALALAAALYFGRTPSWRAAVVLAVSMALALLSGQGYLQFGLLFVLPALLAFFPGPDWKLRTGRLAAAAGLTGLLLAFFLLPALRFWPNLTKSLTFTLEFAQPLEYFVLNFVIRDLAFLDNASLAKAGGAWLFGFYLGWIPVLLAAVGLATGLGGLPGGGPRERRRVFFYLAAVFFLGVWAGTGQPIMWLFESFPQISFLRWPPLLAGLAVPGLLGLAAAGVDWFWRQSWPHLGLELGTGEQKWFVRVELVWLLLIPLAFALRSAWAFSTPFIGVSADNQPVYDTVRPLASLGAAASQWVDMPFGEHFWVEPALSNGIKLNNVVWAWGWSGRANPPAKFIVSRDGPPANAVQVTSVGAGDGALKVYEMSGVEYAAVYSAVGMTPCTAEARNGRIQVECTSTSPGTLKVYEHAYAGWRVWVNGEKQPLTVQDNWLAVAVPAGNVVVEFRYQPWDVPVGLFLSVVGLALCGWLAFRKTGGMDAMPPAEPTDTNLPEDAPEGQGEGEEAV